MKYKITVFTPTYNRAYILDRLYRSLQRQQFSDFEWLIVDDGSIDNTEDIIHLWAEEENRFPIRYYKKQNGGKCQAINYALDRAQGELFFTVDSDDYLTPDALEKIVKWESEIPHDGSYCGVAGNLGTDENTTSNTLFEEGYYDGTLLDRYKNVDGERAIVIYTVIHQKYKYPNFDNETFMTEAVVWNRMAHDGYKMRFYNDIVWIYEYKPDGLTRAGNRLFVENPYGYGLWIKERNVFQKGGWQSLVRMYYSMYAELHQYYDTDKIADCLQTSKITIKICKFIYGIKHKERIRSKKI